ncbi:phage major capsid protein [Heyndrickxia coagulans]|jgi:HK97 family phage major capsid protein|nr:phage major capsid protein [Heyndrickxia coagulans]
MGGRKMSKELRELLNKLNQKKAAAKVLMGKEDATPEEIQVAAAEINELKAKIEAQKLIDEETAIPVGGKPVVSVIEPDKNSKEYRELHTKAFLNYLRKKPLTEEMKNTLSSNTGSDGGYLIPQDINTQINNLKRQYKSAKMCCTEVYTTSTKTGSFVWEDLSTLTPLVNMTEMTDLDSSSQPKFRSVQYAVKDMGAILPIPNTLLQDEDANLIAYIAGWFAKKAIRTENNDIFNVLKTGKTPVALADWKALKSNYNTKLDPLIATNGYFCTNQDGFNVLDSALDGFGRPVLQPNPQNPTELLFLGKVVHMFSNTELPSDTDNNVAPIFFGDMKSGCRFVDRGAYELSISTEAYFVKNATAVRVIERYDVIKTDSDAYQFGQIALPEN